MAVLGLRFCARAFSSCGEQGPLFIAVRGPLTVAASPVTEHRLQTRRLSSCGSRAQLLRGMWDPPGPGHKPVSPALAGGLPTTAPPGKPEDQYCLKMSCFYLRTKLRHNIYICTQRKTYQKVVYKTLVTTIIIQWLWGCVSWQPEGCLWVAGWPAF